MCGIAGILSPNGAVSSELLDVMSETLIHRGPDGAGSWISLDNQVGLAHRRLSIIDLSADAGQPMHDPRERAVIVFNGEIYNHRELRAELEAAGVKFRTDHSDTEAILAGYLHWGLDELLRRLTGMFAFAIYDHEHRRIFLVRDRVGIKPLYFAEVGGDFLFASEIKAILRDPRLPRKLDLENFNHYLSFRATPAPGTLFQGVQTLRAGELLEFEVQNGRWSRRTWWNPLLSAAAPPASLAEAQDRLEELLTSAVDYRLEADVPVGLFLSGGLDSAYLSRLMASRGNAFSTYTIGYPGFPQYDESRQAAVLAAEAGACHHEVPLEETAFGDALTAVAYYQDEPIAAPVCTSVYFLSQAARDSGVKVVLTGEGSDELFVGYDKWLRLRDLEHWNSRWPDLPGRWLRRGAHTLAAAVCGADWAPAEILRRSAAGQPLFWGGSMDFTEAAKGKLLGPAAGPSVDTYSAVVEPLRREFLQHRKASDVTAWMSFVDLRFRLPQLMLPRMDKMGMAFSIEGRVPYLDHRLIELVLSLPPQWRGGVGRVGKPLLKSVATRRLPRSFVYQKKRGFQAPVKEWKHRKLGRSYGPALLRFADRTGLFQPSALAELLQRPNDRLYFGLTNFMLWYSLFIENVLDDTLPALTEFKLRRGLV